jgi:5-methylthioribose kinase
MRILNHEHIFRLPLAPDNGLDLDAFTPGLAEAALPLQRDSRYVSTVHELGEIYLRDDGPALLHGDYFPGSWLETDRGPMVIDPEFCFFGPGELDLGVMLAHLYLAREPEPIVSRLMDGYLAWEGAASGAASISPSLVRGFAGVEIMRRLIGVAQIPLPYALDVKKELLDTSHRLVLD